MSTRMKLRALADRRCPEPMIAPSPETGKRTILGMRCRIALLNMHRAAPAPPSEITLTQYFALELSPGRIETSWFCLAMAVLYKQVGAAAGEGIDIIGNTGECPSIIGVYRGLSLVTYDVRQNINVHQCAKSDLNSKPCTSDISVDPDGRTLSTITFIYYI